MQKYNLIYFNHISSPFNILGRNAQYLCNGERIVQRREMLPSRWSPIHQTNLSLFSIVPFQAKGKRRKRGWRIEADVWHTRPIFSSFTANSLNRIMRIWVRFKRYHRKNRGKTILFFYCYDTKRTVVKRGQNPVSCYIQLSSLAMFSLQLLKISC